MSAKGGKEMEVVGGEERTVDETQVRRHASSSLKRRGGGDGVSGQ